MKYGLWLTWVSLFSGLMVASAGEEPFPPPADGPVPFRRDRVPLDTDGISQLAKAMREIAEATEVKTAVDRRALAQMLAVSIALGPESDHAKRLLQQLPERDFETQRDQAEVEKQLERVWESVEWLETPDAGIDGQALAACLKDVLVVADPKHPRTESLRSTGEQAAWRGWVPVLAEYESRSSDSNEEEDNPEGAAQSEDKAKLPPPMIRLAETSVPALFWKNTAKEWPPIWKLMPLSLTMKAEIRPRAEWEIEQGIHRKTVSIGSHSGSSSLNSMESRVESMLRNKFDPLPADLVIEIRHPELDQSIESGQRHALSGVCGGLAYAAISGIEPAGLIVGQVEEDGRFLMTTDYWSQLQPLVELSGLRLIVPEEAEEVLMAFLGLEKPDFFLNNQVLLAKDIDEVMRLAAKKPEPQLEGVFSRFSEIKDRKGAQDVRIYIGNSFIRQRLNAIHQEEPRHLSSKALVIQALGKRPTTVARPVLVSELKKSLDLTDWIRSSEYIAPKTEKPLGATEEACRSQINQISRYAKKEDQEFVAKAIEVVDAVRDLERATKGRDDYWEVEGGIRSKQRTLKRVYDEFEKLADDTMRK